MKSIASSDPQQINSPPQLADIVPIRPRAVRDEERVPYGAGYQAERNGQYEAGFVIVPCEVRTLPRVVDVGDGKKPIPRAAMTGVYVELAAYVRDRRNVVWPSVKTLAESCGYSDDYTARVLVALETCGAITKSHRDNNGMKRSNQYTLNHQKSPENQIPPAAATIPPVAVLDTATGGSGYRPQRQEVDKGEVDKETPPLPPKRNAARYDAKERVPELSPDAELRLRAFRERYPVHRRSGNARELAMLWGTMTTQEQQAALASLTAWTACPEWAEQNGRYVPLIAKFLAERRWESAPAAPPSTGNKTVDLLRSMGI